MEERKTILVNRLPLFLPTISKINEAKIEWMLGGSGCLYLLGNNRIPDDADIYLRDKSHDIVDKLFNIKSYTYKSDVETVRNSNPEGSHDIQITSHLKLNIEGKAYNLGITDEMIKKRRQIVEIDGNAIWLLSPEDVLIIKALLQRGPDVGKNDLKDIQSFMRVYPNLDRAYIESRIKSLGAEERVGSIFF